MYEYFPSKEALIASAVLYGNARDCEALLEEMEAETGFLAQVSRGLERLSRQARANHPLFLLLTGKLPPAVMEQLARTGKERKEYGSALWRRGRALIDRGVQEGVLARALPEDYLRQTLTSLFLGYQCALLHAGGAPDRVEKARENALRLLLAALGRPEK